jgi:hypothetical protein
VGTHQPSVGQYYCSEKKDGFVLVAIMGADGQIERYDEQLCASDGVDCSGAVPSYTGSMWHDPSKQAVLTTTMYTWYVHLVRKPYVMILLTY